jgi:hypothetical protein
MVVTSLFTVILIHERLMFSVLLLSVMYVAVSSSSNEQKPKMAAMEVMPGSVLWCPPWMKHVPLASSPVYCIFLFYQF